MISILVLYILDEFVTPPSTPPAESEQSSPISPLELDFALKNQQSSPKQTKIKK